MSRGTTEADWVITEFGGVDLGDKRRTDRVLEVVTRLAQRPAASLPAACGDLAALKGTYRLLENPAVAPAALLSGHVAATWERLVGEPVVLAVQDTTELDFSTHQATAGLGPIGNGYGRGLLVHSTLAVLPNRLPLGLLAQAVWTRPQPPRGQTRHQRKSRAIQEKESQKWLVAQAAVAAGLPQAPAPLVVSVGDREADVYDLFIAPRPARLELLVRAAQDRLTGEEAPVLALRAALAQGEAGVVQMVDVPRRGRQAARQAQVRLRWQAVTLHPPKRRAKEHLPPVTLWAVWAIEEQPPPDVEALDWLLLSSLPVTTLAQAQEKLDWYQARWTIELWHKVLKSGCAFEQRQLASAENLRRGLVLYSVIAWRILYGTVLARVAPAVPCSVLLDVAEWQALYCAIHKTPVPPDQPPTLAQAVRWIAELGGFLGRRGDGQPGVLVLWRGLTRLVDLTLMFQVFTPPAHRQKSG